MVKEIQNQLELLVGSRSQGYVVGVGRKFPRRIHHRARWDMMQSTCDEVLTRYFLQHLPFLLSVVYFIKSLQTKTEPKHSLRSPCVWTKSIWAVTQFYFATQCCRNPLQLTCMCYFNQAIFLLSLVVSQLVLLHLCLLLRVKVNFL